MWYQYQAPCCIHHVSVNGRQSSTARRLSLLLGSLLLTDCIMLTCCRKCLQMARLPSQRTQPVSHQMTSSAESASHARSDLGYCQHSRLHMNTKCTIHQHCFMLTYSPLLGRLALENLYIVTKRCWQQPLTLTTFAPCTVSMHTALLIA